MKVVVTIPAYNEEKTIGKVIEDIKRVLSKEKISFSVFVVDDGSADKTVKVAKKAGAKVHSHPANLGLAETFRTEMKKMIELGADIIVHTDADSQYLAKDIPKLIKPVIDKKADLVLGSRFSGSIEYMPFIKRWGNRAFSRVISRIVGTRISDGQTGFRAFTKEIAMLKIHSSHTYTQEQIIRAAKHKFRISEVPVYFAKREDKSRLMRNPFEYAAKAWINIFRIYRDYEPLKFFGFFGGIFFALGILFGLWILYNLLTTSSVGGLPRVMLTVLLITVGIQIWLFGFLADMLRK